MTHKQILSFITEVGIVPVVRTTSAESAIRAIEAIYNGGIRAAEITMTVPGAIRALEKVADQFGDKIVLGAGTVLDPETARICMLAGAEFFVTPSLKLSTIEVAKRYSKVICPVALTTTEVVQHAGDGLATGAGGTDQEDREVGPHGAVDECLDSPGCGGMAEECWGRSTEAGLRDRVGE